MIKRKGLSITEIGLVTATVIGVSFVAVNVFGDNLSAVFSSRNVANQFSEDRVIKPKANEFYISKNKIDFNGKEFKSPIEKAVIEALKSGEIINQAGTRGNIQELSIIMDEYLIQLKDFMKEVPEEYDTTSFEDALLNYKKLTDDYKAKNNTTVSAGTDPVVKLISGLDLSLNLDEKGDAAVKLNAELVSLTSQLKDENLKNLLTAYTKDLQNLGKSIDFTIDSRSLEILGIEPQKSKVQEMTELLTTALTYSTNASAHDTLDESIVNMDATDSRKGCSGGCIREEDENSAVLKFLKYFETEDKTDMVAECTFNYVYRKACWDYDKIPYHNLNGETISTRILNDGQIMLKNGVSFTVEMHTGYDAVAAPRYIYIDTDGPFEGENTMGKDIFVSMVFEDKVVPYGHPDYPMNVPIHHTKDQYPPNQTCELQSAASINTGWPCAYQEIEKQNIINKKNTRDKILDYVEKNPDDAAELLKGIKVFRNGNYGEIANSTYNTDVLCNTVNAEVKDNKCTINP